MKELTVGVSNVAHRTDGQHSPRQCWVVDDRRRQSDSLGVRNEEGRNYRRSHRGVCFSMPSILSSRANRAGVGNDEYLRSLAGSTVTNTGPTSITGDVGVSPGTAITGFPPGVVLSGSTHSADAAALQAESDLTAAYTNLAGRRATPISLVRIWADSRLQPVCIVSRLQRS